MACPDVCVAATLSERAFREAVINILLALCECCETGSGGGELEDQTHVLVHGDGESVPAGLKAVTISCTEGVTTIDGAFELGDDRRPDGISYNATEISGARGLLPAIALVGGTFQWSGIMPIAEVS